MLQTMREYQIDPASLIHALQNHDELTLELVHFWTLHANDTYTYQDRAWKGSELREHIRAEMYDRLTGPHAPYNLRFVTNGVACTTASIVAAALGIRDLEQLTNEQRQSIQKLHLLLVIYNAFQPGVFALSGWDLVGALPLPADAVAHLMGDGDTRWINRGAYDLGDVNSSAAASQAGLPKSRALYGSLPAQLAQPDSFASRLKRLLAIRQQYEIYAARQIAVPDVSNKGLLVMVHELPGGRTQLTALNFGAAPIEETVTLTGLKAGAVTNMLTGAHDGYLSADGQLILRLEGYEGKSLLV
jgi:trehalose synthase